jgi:hypothetical protein
MNPRERNARDEPVRLYFGMPDGPGEDGRMDCETTQPPVWGRGLQPTETVNQGTCDEQPIPAGTDRQANDRRPRP